MGVGEAVAVAVWVGAVVGTGDGGLVKVGGTVAVGTAVMPGAGLEIGTAVAGVAPRMTDRATAVGAGGGDAQATPPHRMHMKTNNITRISPLSDQLSKLASLNCQGFSKVIE